MADADGLDPALRFHERTELLRYLLQNFEKHGGRVLLPIGIQEPENWLLERVDVEKLLAELESGATQLELVKLGRNGQGTMHRRPGHKRTGSYVTSGLAEAAASSPIIEKHTPFTQSAPERAAAPAAEDAGDDDDDTLLPLPQLQTGLKSEEMKDLSFLVLAAVCPPEHQDLLPVICQQLDIVRERADQITHSTRHILSRPSRPTTPRPSVNGTANGSGIPGSPSQSLDSEVLESPYHYSPTPTPSQLARGWRQIPGGGGGAPLEKPATMQLLAALLERARRGDFDSFKAFVRWRKPVAHTLVEGLQQAARESWIAPATAPQAKTLIARLKGAVRRLDVTDQEDYDEGEYAEAARAVGEIAATIAGSVRDGWQFPWSLRVRIAEMLLRCLFDTLEETSYIEEHEELLALLRQRVWPLLGVSPLMDAACITWAHFSQFLAHPGDEGLLERLQGHIQGLAEQAGGRRTSRAAGDEEEQQLAAQVGQKIVEWTAGKLADYHANFSNGQDMEGCLDLLRFAIHSQGGGQEVVSEKLGQLVVSSVSTEYQRRINALQPSSGADELLDHAEVTAGMMADEGNYFSPPLEEHLRGARAFAALRLHAVYSHSLIPFLDQIKVLDEKELEAIRTADALEVQLVAPIHEAMHAQGGCDPEVERELRAFYTWGIDTHLQNAGAEWVSRQRQLLFTCLQRNLQAETWRPLGAAVGHSGSARDIAQMVVTSVDTLFDFAIPLPPTVVNMLVEVIDNVLSEYAVAVEREQGQMGRLIPPAPPLTRFKAQESLRQEQAESGVAPRKGLFGGRGLSALNSYPAFLESVPRIDTSLDALHPRCLACKAASLAFLREEAARLADAIPQRHAACCSSRTSRRTTRVLEDILESACQRLKQGIEYTLRFLATKVIFWDGRMDWMEKLYRHRVTGCPVTLATLSGPIVAHLEEMGQLLYSYAGNLSGHGDPDDTLVHDYAAALLAMCSQAIERVLLNGGPTRLFVLEDVATIKADLQHLKAVFLMDGEGLLRDAVEAKMQAVYGVLEVMALPTGPLVHDLQAAQLAGNQPKSQLFLQVAAHRADRNASKHLKTYYNLSKRLK